MEIILKRSQVNAGFPYATPNHLQLVSMHAEDKKNNSKTQKKGLFDDVKEEGLPWLPAG